MITMSVFVESVRRGHEDSLKLLKQIGGFMGDAIGMLVNISRLKRLFCSVSWLRSGISCWIR